MLDNFQILLTTISDSRCSSCHTIFPHQKKKKAAKQRVQFLINIHFTQMSPAETVICY